MQDQTETQGLLNPISSTYCLLFVQTDMEPCKMQAL